MPDFRVLTVAEFAAYGAADRLSIRRYGQLTEQVESDVTLAAATVGRLLNSDSDRVSWLLSNSDLTNALAVSGLQAMTFATGVVVGALGGAAARDAVDDGSVVGRELWGISTAGATAHIVVTRCYGDVLIPPPGVGSLT